MSDAPRKRAPGVRRSRRMAGLVGQWGTLLGCGAILAGLVWLGAVAAPNLRQERRCRMAWTDFVTAPRDRRVYLDGWVSPPAPTEDAPLVVADDATGRRLLSVGRRGRWMGLACESAPAGLMRMNVAGTIYGPLAYQRDAVRILAVGAGQRLWMVDAGLIESLGPKESAGLLASLGRAGAVAAFHVGQRERLAAVRQSLAGPFPDLPVAGRGGSGATDPEALARDIRRYLRQRPIMLTADPVSADQLARGGAVVHLLGGEAPPGVRRHENLGRFKEFLSTGPIGQ